MIDVTKKQGTTYINYEQLYVKAVEVRDRLWDEYYNEIFPQCRDVVYKRIKKITEDIETYKRKSMVIQ